ncbi:hypothetical protein CRENBAI_022946 [Crenichthys baileyi]|uniref:Uncharacterized protein n=1 Tax=Crenichthys baileyi TaxID=28760 RepID=A0AAV9SA10_9TELE
MPGSCAAAPGARSPPSHSPEHGVGYLVDPASSICLSQRLSHASLSTHGRANTCKRALTFGDACIYQTQNPCGVLLVGAPAALVTLDNLEPIAGPPWRRRLIRMSALSTFDGTLRAYHGDHG